MVDAETEEPSYCFGAEPRRRRETRCFGYLREDLRAVGQPECRDEPCVEGRDRDLGRRRGGRDGLGVRQACDDRLELRAGERIVGSRCRRLGHYSGGDYGL